MSLSRHVVHVLPTRIDARHTIGILPYSIQLVKRNVFYLCYVYIDTDAIRLPSGRKPVSSKLRQSGRPKIDWAIETKSIAPRHTENTPISLQTKRLHNTNTAATLTEGNPHGTDALSIQIWPWMIPGSNPHRTLRNRGYAGGIIFRFPGMVAGESAPARPLVTGSGMPTEGSRTRGPPSIFAPHRGKQRQV